MSATPYLAVSPQAYDNAVSRRMAIRHFNNSIRRQRFIRSLDQALASAPATTKRRRGAPQDQGDPTSDRYEFFIDDDRYQVFREMTEAASSLASARHRAALLLSQSTHRRKVMVYRDREYLCTVTPGADWPGAYS